MARILKELQFETRNDVGVLSEVTEALKNSGVNLTHAWACGEGSRGYFGLITSDNSRAKKALKKIGIYPKEIEVLNIRLPNKTGELAKVAKKLSKARISITSVAATSGGNGRHVSLLVQTRNNQKARRII